MNTTEGDTEISNLEPRKRKVMSGKVLPTSESPIYVKQINAGCDLFFIFFPFLFKEYEATSFIVEK